MTDRKQYMKEYYARKKGKVLNFEIDCSKYGEKKATSHVVGKVVETPPQQVEKSNSTVESIVEIPQHPVETIEPQDFQLLTGVKTASTSSKQLTSTSSKVSTPPQQVSTVFQHSFLTYAASFLIVCFLIANSGFLVAEQIRFYELKGYGVGYAIFISVLAEVATIFLSFMTTWQQRPIYLVVLLPSLGLIFALIFCGLNRTQDYENRKSKVVEILEKELGALELKNQTKSVLAKKEKKQEELLKALNVSSSGSDYEVWVLSFLRLLSIVWNAIFASILASMFIRGPRKQFFPQA